MGRCLALIVLIACISLEGCGDQVANNGAIDTSPVDIAPVWCPTDDNKILFTHLAETWEELQVLGDKSVWTVDLESGAKTLITRGIATDWSSDGTWIGLTRGLTVLLLDPVAKEETPIAECRFNCGNLRFVPGSNDVSYFVQDSGTKGTWMLDLETSERRWLSEWSATDWSPDGSEFIAESLVIFNNQGVRTGKIPFTSTAGLISGAEWCPNGTTFAFVADRAIWTISRSGDGAGKVAEDGFGPRWSPDGSRIAWSSVSGDGKGMVIWTMNADGSEKTQVTFPGTYLDSD